MLRPGRPATKPSRFLIGLLLAMTLLAGACRSLQNLQAIRAYQPTLMDASPADTTVTDVTGTTDAEGRTAQLLSAFFGLDDGLPRPANKGVCEGAGGKDGMPVIFSHEIDVATLQAGDFQVTRASGATGGILCATLHPADDVGERRTVLLAGSYGSAEDEPVKVEIVGNLLSIDGSVNFKGANVVPTPLERGATMVLAEAVAPDQFELGKPATPLRWGGGDGCPLGTRQIVNVVWAGGVSKPGGDEVDDTERVLYAVTVRKTDGAEIEVAPFALADRGDGDNNHRLCLDVDGTPTSVSFPAGHLVDPRGDLNPATAIAVSTRPTKPQ